MKVYVQEYDKRFYSEVVFGDAVGVMIYTPKSVERKSKEERNYYTLYELKKITIKKGARS